MKDRITLGQATLPLNNMANAEGFISVTDALGYFVVCLAPIQVKALVSAVLAVADLPVCMLPATTASEPSKKGNHTLGEAADALRPLGGEGSL